jgi:type VI secretion system secreted protein VgrG
VENLIKSTVTIDGQTLDQVNYINLVQRFDWHHTFEINVPIGTFGSDSSAFETAKSNIGKQVTIELKAAPATSSSVGDSDSDVGSDGDTVTQANYRPGSFTFKGMVTSISLSKSGRDTVGVVIKGFSPTVTMEDGLACKAFNEKSLSSILSGVLSDYSGTLDSNVSLSPDPQMGYCVQYNESNYNFLSRMAATYGQWCYYDGQQLVLGKLVKSSDAYTLVFGVDLESYHFDLKLAPLQFNAQSPSKLRV